MIRALQNPVHFRPNLVQTAADLLMRSLAISTPTWPC